MAFDGLFPRPATGAMPSQRLSQISGLAGWRNGWGLPFRWGMNAKVNMSKTSGRKDEWIITNWNDIYSTFPRVPLISTFQDSKWCGDRQPQQLFSIRFSLDRLLHADAFPDQAETIISILVLNDRHSIFMEHVLWLFKECTSQKSDSSR